jgi:hypothetical protein
MTSRLLQKFIQVIYFTQAVLANVSIIFHVSILATSKLLAHSLLDLILGQDGGSSFASSSNITETYCDPRFCSGGVHVLLNLMLNGLKKSSRKTEVITAGMELMKHGSASCFNEITVVINK